MARSVLVTGCAGFIGYHLSRRLLTDGNEVWGIDNLNEYYDVRLKWARLASLEILPSFHFLHMSLEDRDSVAALFNSRHFDCVVNLAAQAGVRYSLTHPRVYIESNLTGFLNVLEGCRAGRVGHLVFASSSSVYGANTQLPFSVHDNVDHPVSLYAATKKANELMAHTYSHLYGLPCTGLRFFTVYGPWGRPDMALFLFTAAILENRVINVFNFGNMRRDFTYIDDVVEGVARVTAKPPQPHPLWTGNQPDPGSSSAAYRIYNIGNGNPVELIQFIEILEHTLGKKAKKNLLPLQAGDIPVTHADVEDFAREFGFRPKTSIEEGVARFVDWYRTYYQV